MIFQLFFKEHLILRLLGATLTALILSLYLAPRYIKYLSKWQPNQPPREHVPERHLQKKGTPTSGGIIILTSYVFSSLIWAFWGSTIVWIASFALLFFGGIGLLDDIYKIRDARHKGLSARYKYSLQSLGGLLLAVVLYAIHLKTPQYTIGPIIFYPKWLFIPWAYWVIVGTSNAFNLTDGLDGLAISQTIIITFGLLVLSLQKSAAYIPYIEELSVLCCILAGSSLGFLWYNIYPARVFMGDTGALALGAILATLALILNQEIIFAVMSLVPLVETISVILQVIYFKKTQKRLFRMAPLHHHYELLGLKEPKIVAQFSLVTILMVTLCLFFALTHDSQPIV